MSKNEKTFELIVPKKISMISAVTDFTGAEGFDVSEGKSDLPQGQIPNTEKPQAKDNGVRKTNNAATSLALGLKKSEVNPVPNKKHFDLYIPSDSKRSVVSDVSGLTEIQATTFKSPFAPDDLDMSSVGGSEHLLPPIAKPTHYDIVTTICRGRNLVARDKGFLGQSPTSDPYVKIYFTSSVFGKTSTVQKTLNPSWGETFTFTIESGLVESNKNIEFKIFDYNLLTKHEPMGTVYVHIPIEDLNNETVKWYPVKPGLGSEECKDATGDLQIELEVRPR